MPKLLVIGDVHATPTDLADCEALWRLVGETVNKYDCTQIVLLGDLHHTHDILNTRVIDFWVKALKNYDEGFPIVAIVGNHDQLTPSIRGPHSLIPYRELCQVIDTPQQFNGDCYMPYYYNPAEFVEQAVKLKEANLDVDTLFCHQTFTGADGGLGFFSKDAVEPSAVPFKRVISGHIHKPMRLGKVAYFGAPRWKTLTDAETEIRNIYILEPGKPPIAIPTNTHCTRIYKFDDSEETPLNINLTDDELSRADLRITVLGSSDYISKRMTELKAKYNAKCRGVPVRSRLAKASESEGILTAFNRFSESFTPPNGSDKKVLLKEAYERIQATI